MATLDCSIATPKRKRGIMPFSLRVGDLTPPRNPDELGGSDTPTHADSPQTLSVTGTFKSMYLDESTKPQPSDPSEHYHYHTPRKRLRFTPPPQDGEQETGPAYEDMIPQSSTPKGYESTPEDNTEMEMELSSTLPASPPPSNSPSPVAAQRSLKRKKSPPPDEVSNPFTWHDSEITGHMMSDPDDDGTGINGVGFKPTPAVAYARAQRRRQQVADWKAREARDARQKRIEKRRFGQRQACGLAGLKRMDDYDPHKGIRVRFA